MPVPRQRRATHQEPPEAATPVTLVRERGRACISGTEQRGGSHTSPLHSSCCQEWLHEQLHKYFQGPALWARWVELLPVAPPSQMDHQFRSKLLHFRPNSPPERLGKWRTKNKPFKWLILFPPSKPCFAHKAGKPGRTEPSCWLQQR